MEAKTIRELHKRGMSEQDLAIMANLPLMVIQNVLVNRFAETTDILESFEDWAKRVRNQKKTYFKTLPTSRMSLVFGDK